jgi:hypothetical protein
MDMRKVLLLAVVWSGGAVWADQIGAVSGVVGSPTIAGAVAHMDTKINDGDEVITGPGEAVALCLDSKVVIKLDARTAIKVRELPEKTDIQLEHGKARVYIAKRDGTRPVVMTDPKASVTAHGTVFLGDFDDQTGNSSYSADESNISVNSGGQTTNVGPGQQANYAAGQLLGLGASTGGVGGALGTLGTLDQAGRQDAVVTQQRQSANVAAFSILNTGRTSSITPVETNTQGNNSSSNNGTGTNENGQNPAGGNQTEASDQAAPPVPSYNVGQLNTGAGTPPIPAGVVQNQTVTNLVQSGQVPGITPTPVTSTGGFSDITAHLTAGGTLDFSVRDNGIPDGDTINLSVVNNGATVLTQQNVVLTSAAQKFSAPASAGNVDLHIVSVSDGQVPPNTGQVSVANVDSGKAKQSYGINAGDEAILHIAANAAPGPAGAARSRARVRR